MSQLWGHDPSSGQRATKLTNEARISRCSTKLEANGLCYWVPCLPKSEPLKITQPSQIHSMEATLVSSETTNISGYCHENVTSPSSVLGAHVSFLTRVLLRMPISPCLPTGEILHMPVLLCFPDACSLLMPTSPYLPLIRRCVSFKFQPSLSGTKPWAHLPVYSLNTQISSILCCNLVCKPTRIKSKRVKEKNPSEPVVLILSIIVTVITQPS